jgi:hypothetical protein
LPSQGQNREMGGKPENLDARSALGKGRPKRTSKLHQPGSAFRPELDAIYRLEQGLGSLTFRLGTPSGVASDVKLPPGLV